MNRTLKLHEAAQRELDEDDAAIAEEHAKGNYTLWSVAKAAARTHWDKAIGAQTSDLRRELANSQRVANERDYLARLSSALEAGEFRARNRVGIYFMPGHDGVGGEQKGAAFEAANRYCASQGKQMMPLATHQTDSGFGKIAEGEVNFKCIAQPDHAVQQ
jgi:hypothetical protein